MIRKETAELGLVLTRQDGVQQSSRTSARGSLRFRREPQYLAKSRPS
jgi:hypothetical protein